MAENGSAMKSAQQKFDQRLESAATLEEIRSLFFDAFTARNELGWDTQCSSLTRFAL